MVLFGLYGLLINFLSRIKVFLGADYELMMVNKSFVFRFDDVEVREREFTLLKAGTVVTVEPKAFRALLFLLRNPQKLISKEELLNSVWGDAAVTEGSLTRCIWLLRRELGDNVNEPRYIATVATVGYRFVCRVEVSEDDSAMSRVPNGRIDPGADKSAEAVLKESAAEALEPKEQAVVGKGEAESLQQPAKGLHLPIRNRFARNLLAACTCCVLLVGTGMYLLKAPPPKTEGFRFGPLGYRLSRLFVVSGRKGDCLHREAKGGRERTAFLRI